VAHWIGKISTAAALCCAIGLQWIALQSVAWTAMIIQNTRQASLCHAVERAFDGTHPCSLCHIVNKGRASEQKPDLPAPTVKIDMICVARAIPSIPIFEFLEYVDSESSFLKTGQPPSTPPPRTARS
jgi:hypothetical protein